MTKFQYNHLVKISVGWGGALLNRLTYWACASQNQMVWLLVPWIFTTPFWLRTHPRYWIFSRVYGLSIKSIFQFCSDLPLSNLGRGIFEHLCFSNFREINWLSWCKESRHNTSQNFMNLMPKLLKLGCFVQNCPLNFSKIFIK